ncbi:hypothetical protein [Leifsonia sp. fls2-241-R2A-40a]|uniref:hypothetical protein n=1 Tax=Leifsonia sp. fls2-241-R2A-40a TaxID=3040290 RepID=UPI00254F29BB|nr:hypothetical protein [Leifsonia sp. fls2-241-R2A-40a]
MTTTTNQPAPQAKQGDSMLWLLFKGVGFLFISPIVAIYYGGFRGILNDNPEAVAAREQLRAQGEYVHKQVAATWAAVFQVIAPALLVWFLAPILPLPLNLFLAVPVALMTWFAPFIIVRRIAAANGLTLSRADFAAIDKQWWTTGNKRWVRLAAKVAHWVTIAAAVVSVEFAPTMLSVIALIPSLFRAAVYVKVGIEERDRMRAEIDQARADFSQFRPLVAAVLELAKDPSLSERKLQEWGVQVGWDVENHALVVQNIPTDFYAHGLITAEKVNTTLARIAAEGFLDVPELEFVAAQGQTLILGLATDETKQLRQHMAASGGLVIGLDTDAQNPWANIAPAAAPAFNPAGYAPQAPQQAPTGPTFNPATYVPQAPAQPAQAPQQAAPAAAPSFAEYAAQVQAQQGQPQQPAAAPFQQFRA